ncbi:non-ribosomal peptide synthetase, partial [Nocardia sp. CNY236]|uniref:non-ribosomal peptide synthetase n=1 Tax=Nocardia sp. CNY236 TaxID=1169152 RepID=UPI00048A9A2C
VASFDESALGRRKVLPAEGEGTIELVGCGHTVMDTEIAIVEPESGRRLADDEIGEIWVSGQIVAPGYWDRPEDSEKTFHARITGESSDRTHLRTGDLGFRYAGELYICGRVKNLMIVNGVNYYLEDIEATVVSSHESLRAGAVIAFSLERNGQENLVLVAEYQPDLAPAAEDLVTVVHHIVARKHGITPMVVLFIDQGTIPRTTSGKLRRQQCKIDFLAGSLSEVHRWVDLAASETSIAADGSALPAMRSVRDRLQRGLLVQVDEWVAQHMAPDAPTVDVDRTLAEHGMGSIDQMNLHARLEEWVGMRFPPELMWDAASIAAMACAIAEHLEPGGGHAGTNTQHVGDSTSIGTR